MRICVTYPLSAGQRLVLRTEADWDRDVLPNERAATQAWFDVELAAQTLELKPCLVEGDQTTWARGPNSVLTRHESDRQPVQTTMLEQVRHPSE